MLTNTIHNRLCEVETRNRDGLASHRLNREKFHHLCEGLPAQLQPRLVVLYM